MTDPIRLRPHHLLCLLTYVGKGYTPDFVRNYDRIADQLSDGREIEIVSGPDDICAPLLAEQAPHCHEESVTARDARAARDVAKALGAPIEEGDRLSLSPARLAQLREAFAKGETRDACVRCDWHDLCTTVANRGYSGVRVGSEGDA